MTHAEARSARRKKLVPPHLLRVSAPPREFKSFVPASSGHEQRSGPSRVLDVGLRTDTAFTIRAMPIGIRTEGLRKVYPAAQQRGDVVALDGLTLEVQPGEIFGLLGPNGAGKSTTVGIVTTRVQPTAGRAWVGDLDVWKNSKAVKRLIGVVPQRPNLDFALTAPEILTFHG